MVPPAAGKTTITNLINRFYDIADGKIRYDGININKIKKADLRRSLGVVLQDTNLFTGTVMDNILLRQAGCLPDESASAAAQLAGAERFHHPPAAGLRHARSPATVRACHRDSGSCWRLPVRRWPIRR